MVSGKMIQAIVALVPLALAAPTHHKRQMQGNGGLSDLDILNFALTAENLESTFYKQGFQMFPDSDFQNLGLGRQEIADLKGVGNTESTHVNVLTQAIQQAGGRPVQNCQYKFGLTNARSMIQTARTLEAVGLSAYLGAAPLINSSMVLTTAATIATVEARHQAFLRVSDNNAVPVPVAFDTPLSPRGTFTLVSQFIDSCPAGSNLNIQPFPAIQVNNGRQVAGGDTLVLQNQNDQPSNAQFCGFMSQGMTQFVNFNKGSCSVPDGLGGEVYMIVTKDKSMSDDSIIAGPSVLTFS